MATGFATASLPRRDHVDARDITAAMLQPNRWRDRIAPVAGIAINIGVLAALIAKLRAMPLGQMSITMPASPSFWILLLGSALLAPAIDWLILRRLWRLPVAGFGALLRKQAANDLFIGYSGDAQFYLWTRARLPLARAPFATLRDLSIMSALAGNVATLSLMACAWPWLTASSGGQLLRDAALGVLMIVFISLGVLAARLRLFTFGLSGRALLMVFVAHLARNAFVLVFCALLWASLLPTVSFATLAILATLRAMTSRLPLVPGKDALFAGAAFAFTGHVGIAGATATVAMLMIGLHAVVAVVGTASDLVRRNVR